MILSEKEKKKKIVIYFCIPTHPMLQYLWAAISALQTPASFAYINAKLSWSKKEKQTHITL